MQCLVGLVHSFERKLLPAILCNKLVQSTNAKAGVWWPEARAEMC